MQSAKALEMLNNGRIEELKAELRDEIYRESLKATPNAKKRYTAMKKYFTYISSVREVCTKPCVIDFEGEKYTSFCNSYSLALTKENCGEMILFNTENGNYPDVARLVNYDGNVEDVDFAQVFAKAKSQGYKLKKSEVNGNNYIMFYDGDYYRVGLLEATYGIIDDGEPATVYHRQNGNRPLTIKTSLGVCMVMPIRYESETDDGVVVVEV